MAARLRRLRPGRGAAAAPGAAAAGRGGAAAPAAAATPAVADAAAAVDDDGPRGRQAPTDGGALTALSYAVRADDLESTKVLLAAGADINEVTGYGWSPLLIATQNRHYKLGVFLLEQGANPNLANKGGWTPLYLATDNRNIENGDYPVRKGDMDHLEFIKILLDKGADVNARAKDSTETRTVFTNQWLSRGRRDRVPAGIAVGRFGADEAAPVARRRPEDRDGSRRDRAARRGRHRLGGRDHHRMVGSQHATRR